MRANYNQTSAYERGLQDGMHNGFQFGINLATIAFNRVCGIGKKRIKEVEKECQRLLDEVVDMRDSAWTDKKIKEALEQIR